MTRITLDLLRKRAEHNNKELSSLQEISLHQENIDRIELLDQVCRHLKILYLQNNIIDRIENVGRLKELEYLNLALNNVRVIQGLEACESLRKLDLTANFVVDVRTVASLQKNEHLRELFLTGNPCTSFEGYFDFVVNALSQLQYLDGTEITKSHRIRAAQNKEVVEKQIEEAVLRALSDASTASQHQPSRKETWYTKPEESTDSRIPIPETDEEIMQHLDVLLDDDAQKRFWAEETEHTPESRTRAHKLEEAIRRAHELKKNPPKQKQSRNFFKADGTPYNINEAGWTFTLSGHDDDQAKDIVLDFGCYRYLDSSQIDLDVQPTYLRITVRDKVFQLALPLEVNPDAGKAHRSTVSGHLLVTMPKAPHILAAAARRKAEAKTARGTSSSTRASMSHGSGNGSLKALTKDKKLRSEDKPQVLEVEATGAAQALTTIVQGSADTPATSSSSARTSANPSSESSRKPAPRENDPDFVDDPDVPPLE